MLKNNSAINIYIYIYIYEAMSLLKKIRKIYINQDIKKKLKCPTYNANLQKNYKEHKNIRK